MKYLWITLALWLLALPALVLMLVLWVLVKDAFWYLVTMGHRRERRTARTNVPVELVEITKRDMNGVVLPFRRAKDRYMRKPTSSRLPQGGGSASKEQNSSPPTPPA